MQKDTQELEHFLAGVERRALQMTRIATSSNEEALDIVQEAMMTLVRRYAQRDGREWPPLFHRILQNRIRDWYRRQAVQRKLFGWFPLAGNDDGEAQAEMDAVAAVSTCEPSHQLSNQRMTDELEKALQALPLRQQQTFLLRVWEGLNVAETAKAMGISSGSVKTHFSRAVHSLRESLGDYRYE